MGRIAKQMGAVSKLPSSDSDGDGMEEVVEIVEMLNGCKVKHVVSVAPFTVEGERRLSPVWVDDDSVSFSKEFYLILVEDILKQCRTPGGCHSILVQATQTVDRRKIIAKLLIHSQYYVNLSYHLQLTMPQKYLHIK